VCNILSGISVLVISLFIIFTGISLYKDYYLKKNMIDPNNYYLNQKNKKIYYRIYDGYFDYKIKDGELKYSIYMAGDGVPFPYCDYLIIVDEGNKDGIFTKMSSEKKIPMDTIPKITNAVDPLKKAFE